ncbi:hypothetical protein Bca52824_007607 [Brassica carinata]|uniref:Uncharacterized protein n=1 Tax=Brassica carinata TaxID=52824 RepID=A0A8X8B5H6_BRACI|nr:hypothetical protein Bca52824_007607 [Brassica carinata]
MKLRVRSSFHDNNLGGSILNLRGVQLFNNRLSGSIPASLGLSRFLQTVDLSNNLLSEAIPQNLADSTKLLRLNLSFNSLSGQIPESEYQNIIIIASGALIIVLLILVFVLLCCVLRKKPEKSKPKGLEARQGAAAAKTEKGGEAELEEETPEGS